MFYSFERNKRSVVVGPLRFRNRLSRPVPLIHEEGGKIGSVHYPARPFMKPANEKQRPKLAGFWKDAVR